MTEAEHPASPPRKRIKVENTSSTAAQTAISMMDEVSTQRELNVGITEFVNRDVPGFSGVFKKRYTDFLVNEVLPSGRVVHLQSLSVPEHERTQVNAPEIKKAEVLQSEINGSAETTKPTPGNTAATNQPEPKMTGTGDDAGQLAWQQFSDTTDSLKLSSDDETHLNALLDQKTCNDILSLFNGVIDNPGRRTRDYGSVRCPVMDNKDTRTQLHQTVRTIFRNRLESYTGTDGAVIVQAAAEVHERGSWGGSGAHSGYAGRGGRGDGRGRRNDRPRPQKQSWAELGGDYLHFTLYKENKDTMEVVSFLARELHMAPKSFQFAGTKDRRGVAAQRISAYRIRAESLVQVGKKARGWKVGDFEYRPEPLALGDLTGNEFYLTLRDCRPNDGETTDLEKLKGIVQRAVDALQLNGFLNYYGLQRFGTFSIGTHVVGMHMLKQDYKAAVDAILSFTPEALAAAQTVQAAQAPNHASCTNSEAEADHVQPTDSSVTTVSQDDRDRALAIHTWQTRRNSQHALKLLPRKFSAEMQVMRYLSNERNSRNYLGAMQTIQRNLRLMYVHAYQSLVWNLAVSERFRRYGLGVVEGDLVMVGQLPIDKQDEGGPVDEHAEEVDADGEIVVMPAKEDRAIEADEIFDRARPLSGEDVASGRYSIFDIVLPTPGFDVLYPSYMVEFYQEIMAKEEFGGLDPHDMRRNWKDISLSGSYRKIMARPSNVEVDVKDYKNENEQFVQTDGDRLNKALGSKTNAETQAEEFAAAQPTQTGHDIGNGKDVSSASDEEPSKLATILKFQLGSSTYATMALRELMKGGLQTYKIEFSAGR